MKRISKVNIKMGTSSVQRFSYGNTLPLTQLPFGMASFCPQSDGKGKEVNRWFYNPVYPYTEGIRLTHQPSPWIGDYGTFLMTPQNDVIADNGAEAWTGYKELCISPSYLALELIRSNSVFELTPTERGCAIRLTFKDERKSCLSILPTLGNYTFKLDKETNTLYGTNDGHSQDVAVKFKMYFVIRFQSGAVDFDNSYSKGKGKDACIHIALNQRSIEAKVAISYISHEMALESLERELAPFTFNALKKKGEDIWEEILSRIEITPESKKQERTFYSCMYRTFLFPRKAYEIKKDGTRVHYSPCDGKIRKGVRYIDNGFWDTYRTTFPLFSMIAREEYAEMLEGFVNDYLEGGWLPRWISIGEVGCMPSTLIDAVIAEAVVNGIGSNELWENALRGMLHHANNPSSEHRYGRNGIVEYLKYGYVPRDVEKESVNLTQDSAYGDWCIAVVADALGKKDLAKEYFERANNYKNIFDKKTGFMRGKDKNGKMADTFDILSWGGEYTEGSAWQNSFATPHDFNGLAELHGGKDKLIKKLDELFNTAPLYKVFGYNGEIHEMTEMAQVDFGQCAISNQPSFHIPFIYAELGKPEKTEYWVRRICTELFKAEIDGYPGDEDNGSMSAWYIFACLGRYPICPGRREHVTFKPLLKGAKILGKTIF
ncbi:MAG: GH92 family glycosyl hydrolase [Clostridia bacterium]|nr:GH92 family glycosyl hydrolase [Clostridia bacterium]